MDEKTKLVNAVWQVGEHTGRDESLAMRFNDVCSSLSYGGNLAWSRSRKHEAHISTILHTQSLLRLECIVIKSIGKSTAVSQSYRMRYSTLQRNQYYIFRRHSRVSRITVSSR